MKIFKGFAKWLMEATHKRSELILIGEDWLVQYGTPDFAEITRKQLKFFDKPKDFSNFTDDQKRSFYRQADALSKDDVLSSIQNEVVDESKEYLLLAAQGDNAINFSRGEISGVLKLQKKLKGYATQITDAEDEEFDPYEAV